MTGPDNPHAYDCSLCGTWHEATQRCASVENEKYIGDQFGIIIAKLCHQDKEQLDRIEALLRDKFRDRLVRAFQQLELTYLSNREEFRAEVLGDAEGDYEEAGEIWADWIIGVMDEDQNP